MLPKVSVIIPNYNHANYLRQRIESVIAQTYKNIEVIILDDHSTDKSVEVINEFKGHSLVKEILVNEKNSGSPFKQWNKGLQVATGEWVWIAESDDYASPDFLKTLLSAVENQPGVGLIYCDSVVVDGELVTGKTFSEIKNTQLKTKRWSHNYFNDGIKELEEFVLPYGSINNTSAVLFKRSVLSSVNPFDLDFRFIGDKYAFVKVLAQSDIAYVNAPLNFYRNPFTQKHFDKFILYFYEHFLVFDWTYRNVNLSRKLFFEAFYANLRNSLFRNWNAQKLKIYFRSFRVNPFLFMKAFFYNLTDPFVKRQA